ncbi:thiol reductant ABC exporter subunit CydC, partial [Kineococcus sp. R8]|uniref:thiol reductant ABC exporter subunit CydC n=1 Tax=Kineococcus siccus TaxID=2696567 RepID=UPI001412DD5C
LTAAAAWLLVTAADRPPVLTLSVAAVLVRASAIARPLLGYAERLVSHDTALAGLAGWRSAVVAALVPRLPGPLSRRRTSRRGDLLVRLVDDVDARVDGLLRFRHPLTVTVVALALALAAAAVASPVIALAAVPGVAVAALLAPAAAARAEHRDGAVREQAAAVASASVEALDGVEDLRGRNAGPDLAALAAAGRALAAAENRRARAGAATAALSTLGTGAAVVGAALGALAAPTAVAPAWAAAAVLAAVPALELVRALPDVARAGVRARAAQRRTRELLAVPEPATEPAVPAPLPASLPTADGGPAGGYAGRGHEVRVEGLVAGWDPGDPVLHGLDLVLAPGTATALRGPSGSGKSTLAAVLLRFLDPVAGRVLLSGTDVRTLAGDDVRSVVGLVGDDEHVFATTLRENLLLAAPGSGDDELRAALRAVRLDDWLAALPAGLDARVGDGGAPLSGGERRRLALARALLADVAVLVLDEPTEGLDEATAQHLTRDLLTAGRRRRDGSARTLLLLAHRGEGLDLVDRVVDLGAEGRTTGALVRAGGAGR